MGTQSSPRKSFDITKQEVVQAWERVKANKGAPGVDGVDLEVFEKDLRKNLYRVWNRMSSGSYFPPPVRGVQIPKAGGGTRLLGVPTVGDRVAQTVVAARVEALVEPRFHDDSYGYRPGRSALDAVEVCRRRCWRYDWVIDLDIEKFFDSVPTRLIQEAVDHVTGPVPGLGWVRLYVARWLAAPVAQPDGALVVDTGRGTPQGSAVSPVLANLFLHWAFDEWMAREFPTVPFERYVDDAVVHCTSKAQAERVLAALTTRMGQVGLRLHPGKTRIVYCKDSNRKGEQEHTQFDFLGFTFRQRCARGKRGNFCSFQPAISATNLKRLNAEVRSWGLHRRTDLSMADLARWINPRVRGWMQYYGAFYRSALYRLLVRINARLQRWVQQKYRRLRSRKKAMRWWAGITTRYPRGFAHWPWTTAVPARW